MSNITLYLGDCLEVMKTIPDKSIDAVITDPPYNINFRYSKYKDYISEAEYINLITNLRKYPTAIIQYPEETMRYFVPALGVPDEVIVWCYNSNLPRQSRLINFYKIKPKFDEIRQPYKNPNDKRIKEFINNTKSDGARIYDWFSDIQQVKNVSLDKTGHPCPLPVELIKRIILLSTSLGDTILDPFMGSGTTGVACVQTGRNFIGIEIDPQYFAIAEKRIKDAQQQMRLPL